MKLKQFLVLLFSSFFFSHVLQAQPVSTPRFTLPDREDNEVSLEQFRGKLVYLDFWASWCPPCLVALPWLNEMSAKYESKGLKIIAINIDQKRRDADRVMAKINPAFTVLFDPEGKVAADFNLPSMPTSFLISPQGEVLHVHKGFRLSDRERLEAEVRKQLQVKN